MQKTSAALSVRIARPFSSTGLAVEWVEDVGFRIRPEIASYIVGRAAGRTIPDQNVTHGAGSDFDTVVFRIVVTDNLDER